MKRRISDYFQFWRYVIQRFFADQCTTNAAALTYTSLFAVVPMMTVAFSILSAVPAFQGAGEGIQAFIFRNFVPSAGQTLQQHLNEFTAQARQMTWVGVAVLAATAFWMLVTIEKTFNTIWRVDKARRGVSSFLLYWAILSLGPLLLGGGFAVSTYITSLQLVSGPDALPGARALLQFMPLLFSVAAFTLLYATVPNTRVPLQYAFAGGFIAAVLFEVAKMLFGLYVRLFPGYQLIYGAFATVPLFLLWIYVSWLIVLFGAELVCSLAKAQRWGRRRLPKLLITLGVLRVFYQQQKAGLKVRLDDIQQQGWKMSEGDWEEILAFLQRENLLVSAGAGAWVLSRDLNEYSLQRLINNSPWPLLRAENLPEQLDEAWYPQLHAALLTMCEQHHELFGQGLASWLQPKAGEAV